MHLLCMFFTLLLPSLEQKKHHSFISQCEYWMLIIGYQFSWLSISIRLPFISYPVCLCFQIHFAGTINRSHSMDNIQSDFSYSF
ncbi:hypothetical protein QJS04_geneDACA017232 [Acorus gramineus]|uniref:Uncharacterized protein n=1 Tax=Acorus gramineus TaxID=55184 RepID=A0AAV8ZZN9_ACOGR|nr:hypothetical protein QJS04_geneDACA017232 [Acorus gramineus]